MGMLVMQRRAGERIEVGGKPPSCVLEVSSVDSGTVTVLVHRPGEPMVQLDMGQGEESSFQAGGVPVRIAVVDLRSNRAAIGVDVDRGVKLSRGESAR